MLVHRARDGTRPAARLLRRDAGAGPRRGRGAEMEVVDVPFDAARRPSASASARRLRRPGALAGLAEAHRRFGPAVGELARAGDRGCAGGVEAHGAGVPPPILDARCAAAGGRALYGEERPSRRASARTCRISPRRSSRSLRRAPTSSTAASWPGRSRGLSRRRGRITERIWRRYRVVRRRPVRAAYRGHEFVSNPPPSSGGVLIAYALRLLDRLGPRPPRERRGPRAPRGGDARGDRRAAPASRASSTAAGCPAAARRRARRRRGRPHPPPGSEAARPEPALPSTTHISVVDAGGNAASLSASTGCGSGVIVPGTGIQLNNMLGETTSTRAGAAPAGRAADEHDGALRRPRRRSAATRRRERGLEAPARRDRPDRRERRRPRHRCSGGDRASSRPPRRRRSPARGWHRGPVAERARGAGYGSCRWRGTSQPLLRRRGASPSAPDGGPRGAGDPRRGGAGSWWAGVDPSVRVRQAEPGDAAVLVELAHEVGAEPEGWLITDGEWRSAVEERRHLAAIRRSRDAAVSSPRRRRDRRTSVDLPRPAPGQPHVADLGLMVARPTAGAGSGAR